MLQGLNAGSNGVIFSRERRETSAIVGRRQPRDVVEDPTESARVVVSDARSDVVDTSLRKFQQLFCAGNPQPLLILAGFHAGRLAEATQQWAMQIERIQSNTNADGVILRVSGVAKV